MRRVLPSALLAALIVLGGGPAAAQPSAETALPPSEQLAVPPIECWWRTGASAVRVGEPFTVVLTCAVLEAASTTVVPDQSRLDPAVLQLQPFEVTGGAQAPDIRTASRRFFQYEYNLRYVGEEFGRDVALPQLQIAYRVQNRVDANAAAIETRDRAYIMPAQQIRIVALVPALAADIRERAPDSFAGIDARRFRANLLDIVSTVLFALGGVLAVWALVRALRRTRGTSTVADQHVTDAAILGEVAREVTAVAREKPGGWTPELATRLLQALRVAGAFETLGHAAQAPWTGADRWEGQYLVRSLVRPGRAAVVTGSATAGALKREMDRREEKGGGAGAAITDLHTALVALEAVLYGRETPARLDMDDALAAGQRAVGRLRRSHNWLALRVAALGRSAQDVRTRVWAR
ncbi:MAG: hypothetical protein Q7J25_03710 [Vicinamibacterales bacterium]|nr:hypothetical protein [Vicinamibacterales bacterium]